MRNKVLPHIENNAKSTSSVSYPQKQPSSYPSPETSYSYSSSVSAAVSKVSQSWTKYQYAPSDNAAIPSITVPQQEKYLKLLQVGFRVINQGESSRFPTTKLSAETECLDSLLGSFVERCKTGADFIFGEIGFGGVENVDDKLFAVEKTVCDEFAGAESGTFVRLTVSISTRRTRGVSSGGGTVEFFKIFNPRNSSMHPSPTPSQRTRKGVERSLTGRQRTNSEIGGKGGSLP